MKRPAGLMASSTTATDWKSIVRERPLTELTLDSAGGRMKRPAGLMASSTTATDWKSIVQERPLTELTLDSPGGRMAGALILMNIVGGEEPTFTWC